MTVAFDHPVVLHFIPALFHPPNFSLAVTLCEMANGIVPFSEMPPTLMLLEKLRGAAPKLMDASTMGEPPAPEEQPELPGIFKWPRCFYGRSGMGPMEVLSYL